MYLSAFQANSKFFLRNLTRREQQMLAGSRNVISSFILITFASSRNSMTVSIYYRSFLHIFSDDFYISQSSVTYSSSGK